MTTAVDTSVLIAIYRGESGARAWAERLAACRAEGSLCMCEVVAAEFFAVIQDEGEYAAVLSALGVELLNTNLAAARRAGGTFRKYRKQGGPHEHLIPDFLVAAHAAVQADRLAALDRGYFRRYFSDLHVIARP